MSSAVALTARFYRARRRSVALRLTARIALAVVRRHAEELGRRLAALQVREPIDRLAGARVARACIHDELQLRREPALGRDHDRLLVADLARGNGMPRFGSFRL